MFSWLSKFDKILVTGPQRAGTRICAKMIAHDTGYGYVDELDLKMDSLYLLQSFLNRKQFVVIQCPVLCRHIHMFNYDNVAIVMMRRKVEDIVASQKRITWPWEQLELARYDRSDGIISEVKYQFWEDHQKDRIKHAFEINYESLSVHPLWTTKGLREDFGPTQTTSPIQSLRVQQNVRPIRSYGISSLDKLERDSIVLVKKESHAILNVTGQFIWNLCDGKHTRQDIFQALRAEFTDFAEEILLSDLDEFILNLAANDFLVLTFPSPENS